MVDGADGVEWAEFGGGVSNFSVAIGYIGGDLRGFWCRMRGVGCYAARGRVDEQVVVAGVKKVPDTNGINISVTRKLSTLKHCYRITS